ncbi:MAG: hypothetical protein JST14_08015 [Bacteroidetes bacterium]|nr:hypothetical protein [Bacteroidota bacterium]
MNILIVTREIKVARALKRGLEEFEFNVHVNENPNEEILATEIGQNDLLILDQELTGGSIALMQRLIEFKQGLAILLLTVENLNLMRIDPKLPLVEYLAKPFQFRELLAKILSLRNKQYTLLNAS